MGETRDHKPEGRSTAAKVHGNKLDLTDALILNDKRIFSSKQQQIKGSAAPSAECPDKLERRVPAANGCLICPVVFEPVW
jgi:hypothetical protein